MLSSALLYSVMDHALSYHTHHTRHGCQKRRVVSTGRGSACIPLIPCMWAPQEHFLVQFNSLTWFGRITFLLPCRGWCLLSALSHPKKSNPAVQQPPPSALTPSCICCFLGPSGGVLPSVLDKSSSCPAHEVMAKASLLPFWALLSFEWT